MLLERGNIAFSSILRNLPRITKVGKKHAVVGISYLHHFQSTTKTIEAGNVLRQS
jgi:hypothetical protein